jgi:hypothetical protein
LIKEIDEPRNFREKTTKLGPPPLSALKLSALNQSALKLPDLKQTTIPLLPLLTSTAMAPPIRGGDHKTHGICIGGGKIRDDWELPGQYRFTSQRRDENYVAKIERNIIVRRDNNQYRQFEGTL